LRRGASPRNALPSSGVCSAHSVGLRGDGQCRVRLDGFASQDMGASGGHLVTVAFRFEGFEGEVEVREIRVAEPVFLDETASSFESSDPLVNAVWRAKI